ncbi:uncharacterized protein [Spinacia oleracea]|uniref:DUF4408 domain-containing protein n=1 Tax=Spinacia oleracea TaxID=3562 RepID=A0A9R0JZE8_SPIOL|nr:uncharacterized protein LOC110792267 [Spinacia oleracea]
MESSSSSYHEIDSIKMEKQKAMRRFRTFKKIANIVRTLEIVVAVTVISYSISFTTSHLPAAVKVAGGFFRRLSSLLFSPHFVFLVGNVIIITLFAKSSADKTSSDNVGDEISSEKFAEIATDGISGEKISSADVGDEITTEAENIVCESPAVVEKSEERESEEKVYRRTKSTSEMVVMKEEKKELRRSETAVRRKIEKSPLNNRKFEVDELSNDEFNRKIEAFIEKQQRFLREEKLAVVLSN